MLKNYEHSVKKNIEQSHCLYPHDGWLFKLPFIKGAPHLRETTAIKTIWRQPPGEKYPPHS